MDKTIKLACLLAIIIFSSCASRKDFVYLQDMDEPTGISYGSKI